MTLNIIGLCGYAGVGKDTAAELMPGWRRFAFADSLKADLEALLFDVGCDLSQSEHKNRARNLLVAWGATARAFKPDYWIVRLLHTLEFAEKHLSISNIVVTDVRYLNEVDALRRLGAVTIRIHRPGFVAANDEEFNSIAIIDRTVRLPEVVNDGSKEELARCILRAYEENRHDRD